MNDDKVWRKDLNVTLQSIAIVSHQSGSVIRHHSMPTYPTAEQQFQPLPGTRYLLCSPP